MDKSRRINRLLQRSAGHPVNFEEMAQLLSELIQANVYVVSRRGKILGYALLDSFECDVMVKEVLAPELFPQAYNQGLLKIDETLPNVSQEQRRCVFFHDTPCLYENKITTVVPVNGGGDRLGTGEGDAGYYIPDEISPSLRFDVPGRLAMANSGPGTDGSQFFITEVAHPELDGNYTIFGQCDAASIQVVRKIARVDRDDQDKPLTPVVLNKVTIVAPGDPLPPLPQPPAPATQPSAGSTSGSQDPQLSPRKH